MRDWHLLWPSQWSTRIVLQIYTRLIIFQPWFTVKNTCFVLSLTVMTQQSKFRPHVELYMLKLASAKVIVLVLGGKVGMVGTYGRTTRVPVLSRSPWHAKCGPVFSDTRTVLYQNFAELYSTPFWCVFISGCLTCKRLCTTYTPL